MRLHIFLITLFCLLGFSQEAAAYLDPGSGSMMLQVLLGFLAAGIFALKRYWKRLQAFFSGDKTAKEQQEGND